MWLLELHLITSIIFIFLPTFFIWVFLRDVVIKNQWLEDKPRSKNPFKIIWNILFLLFISIVPIFNIISLIGYIMMISINKNDFIIKKENKDG